MYQICTSDHRSSVLLDEYGRKIIQKDFVRRILYERKDDVFADPDLKKTYPWTMRGIQYLVKNRLITAGLTEREINSETITGYILPIIRDEMGLTRDELGIYAADRAQFYFKGKWHDVNVKELENLKLMGTDMQIIEKEDVVKALTYYADKYGFGLLNTRGYLTEYAETLTKKIKENGCNVASITDFDIYGMKIAMEQVPDIPRIGIDFDTLRCFNLSLDDPKVKDTISSINKDHFKSFQRLIENKIKKIKNNNNSSTYNNSEEEVKNLESTIEYLHGNRVEINHVLANVGPERFWKFIVDKMTEIYPKRNYNRAIETKPDAQELIPILKEMSDYIQDMVDKKVETQRLEIESDLHNTSGLLDVSEEESKIKEKYKNILNNDTDIQNICDKLQRFRD